MRAEDLAEPVRCNICDGGGRDPIDEDQNCRMCGGERYISRYGPENDTRYGGENIVILGEALSRDTGNLIVQRMPISSKLTGGFNERYGPDAIEDLSSEPLESFQQDMKDQLQNQLGANANEEGQYELPLWEPYNGATLSRQDLSTGSWPADDFETDSDLSIDFIISWLNARGDTFAANLFSRIYEEIREG